VKVVYKGFAYRAWMVKESPNEAFDFVGNFSMTGGDGHVASFRL